MRLGPFCPICGGGDLREFNGRKLARCGNCHAMERTRYLWMVLERHGRLRPGMRVLHLAPEPGLAKRLKTLASVYSAADFFPEQYRGFLPEILRIDLCDIAATTLDPPYDLIIHMHVLEHVPCRVDQVLGDLYERLAPGGRMYFSVPVRPDTGTTEDLDPALTGEDRTRLFGQHDHMRIFGETDVRDRLVLPSGRPAELVVPNELFAPLELVWAAVPDKGRVSAHSIFYFDR